MNDVEQECLRSIFLASYEYDKQITALEPKLPVPQIEGFEWTEDMNEISGFGGGYERMCRAMVSAGCKWWSENPDANPVYRGFKGVFGIVSEDNKDAEALTKAIADASKGDCTGAMHHAAVNHVLAWKTLGSWKAYQEKMREPGT